MGGFELICEPPSLQRHASLFKKRLRPLENFSLSKYRQSPILAKVAGLEYPAFGQPDSLLPPCGEKAELRVRFTETPLREYQHLVCVFIQKAINPIRLYARSPSRPSARPFSFATPKPSILSPQDPRLLLPFVFRARVMKDSCQNQRHWIKMSLKCNKAGLRGGTYGSSGRVVD